MLHNALYEVISRREETEEMAVVRIALHEQHPFYEAHFPGNPITPGACLLDLIHEQAEAWLGCRFEIERIVSLKFLEVIDPRATPCFDLSLKRKANPSQTGWRLLAEIMEKGKFFCRGEVEYGLNG